MARRILIFRNGSLGDTIVALPSFRAIAQAFPDAERVVLTATPCGNRAVGLEAILTGTSYVHGFLSYNVSGSLLYKFKEIKKLIRAFRPDVTVYLLEPMGLWRSWRDAVFLWLCGGGAIQGVPWSKDACRNRRVSINGCYEHEADRLLRVLNLRNSGSEAALKDDYLGLSAAEQREAQSLLDSWPGAGDFIAAAFGSRVPLKDWGEANWHETLKYLTRRYPKLGLAFFGSNDDQALSDRLAAVWRGPILNLCGTQTPRGSAAVMKYARAFIGNDGGAMHLAASVGTPCVAVFTARSPRGVWFPYGKGHRLLYKDVPCSGCLLDSCTDKQRICITSIAVSEVLQEITLLLDSEDFRQNLVGRLDLPEA